MVNFVLAFICGFELFFRDDQRMIAAFHHVQRILRCHIESDFFQKIERTKGVASSLDEDYWRPQIAQDFVAQLLGIASAAQRITEADQSGHRFFE